MSKQKIQRVFCFAKILAYLRSKSFFQKNEANVIFHIVILQGRAKKIEKKMIMGDLSLT